MTPQEPITTRCIHCHQPLPLNPTTIINHLHQHRRDQTTNQNRIRTELDLPPNTTIITTPPVGIITMEY